MHVELIFNVFTGAHASSLNHNHARKVQHFANLMDAESNLVLTPPLPRTKVGRSRIVWAMEQHHTISHARLKSVLLHAPDSRHHPPIYNYGNVRTANFIQTNYIRLLTGTSYNKRVDATGDSNRMLDSCTNKQQTVLHAFICNPNTSLK